MNEGALPGDEQWTFAHKHTECQALDGLFSVAPTPLAILGERSQLVSVTLRLHGVAAL